MRTRLSLLIGALLLVSAIPQPAAAQVIGEDQGVTAVRTSRGYVLRFSKQAVKTYRRIAGKRVEAGCSQLTRVPNGEGYYPEIEGSSTARVPRRGRRIPTGQGGRVDVCSVRLLKSHDLVAMVPITKVGRVYLDELRTSGLVIFALEFADSDGKPLPAADVVAFGKGHIVALISPDASPPADRLGYWTDGRRVVAVALSKAGRRLFIDVEGDVIRTNILSYVMELNAGSRPARAWFS